MALNEQKLKRQFSTIRILLPVGLGLGVVGYMLFRDFEAGHWQTLAQASGLWLILTFLVLVVRDAGYIYRIRYITDAALTWRQSFRVIMLWEFASCALPSVVGGSTVAAYLLYKEEIPLGTSIAHVMVTSLLDNLYFVVAVPVVLLLAGGMTVPGVENLGSGIKTSLEIAFLASYLLIALYAFLMSYALFVNPKAVKRMLIRLSLLRPLKKWRLSLFNHANELLLTSHHLRHKKAAYWVRASVSTK